MKQIAIIYSSKYGQTRKISQYMKNRLSSQGHKVHLIEISKRSPEVPEKFHPDYVVLGAPIYAGRFPSSLLYWMRENRDAWNPAKKAIFTVSLNAADLRPKARTTDQRLIEKLIAKTGFKSSLKASFAGSLSYPHYPWYIRWIMKRISAKAGGPTNTLTSHELTNWPAVDRFVHQIAQELSATENFVPTIDHQNHRPGALI